MSRMIYQKLRRLDIGIAEAYKNAVGDAFSGRISKSEAKKIFRKAIDGDRISPNEAQAMVCILQEARISDDGRRELERRLKSDDAEDALFEGAGRLVVNRGRLQRIYQAIGMDKVGKINFKSRKTGIYYRPSYYRAVRRLIAEDQIAVYKVWSGGLGNELGFQDGSWYSGANEMFIFDRLGDEFMNTVVHEATHVIQDWLDKSAQARYFEADAYIADGVAAHAIHRNVPRGSSPFRTAFHGASRMVYGGDVDFNSRAWKDAYDDVVDAYEKDQIGKLGRRKGRRRARRRDNKKRPGGRREDINEAREFQRILRALANN